MSKLKVIFLGTPKIACNTLTELSKRDDIEICCVVSQPDRPAGRGNKLTPPPVKVLAQELGYDVFQPASIRKDAELINKLKNYVADFFITFAFGQILSQEVLDIPKIGTVNVHASLLPLYRGANPIARAIADGQKETGVTTMLTSLGVDEGDIVLTEKIDITDNMTTAELGEKISDIAPDILHRSLLGLANKEITPTKQNHALATFANKFSKEETFIDFNKPAKKLHNLVRALAPKPAAKTYYNGVLIKLLETEPLEETTTKAPGEIIKKDKAGIYVSTGNGVLLIKKLQPESKKEMPATSWACGIKNLEKFGE